MVVKEAETAMVDIPKHNSDTPQGDKPKKTKSVQDLGACSPQNSFVDVTAMIRSLQRAEGHADCFRTGVRDCDKTDCPWRIYCLEDVPGIGGC